jgi:hypothetical protein
MYNNMSEITLFGIKLEIWIIVGILIFITFAHVGCSCSRIGLMEGMAVLEGLYTPADNKQNKSAAAYMMNPVQEGFTGAVNNGQSAPYSLTNYKPVNTSSWFTPNLTYKAGTKPGKGVQDILNRPKQPIPLPQGEMLMFANTPFSPKCCPSEYSNSQGCACVTVPQRNYLVSRGGNNVPYSEY